MKTLGRMKMAVLVMAGFPLTLHSAPLRFAVSDQPATLQLSASQESSGIAVSQRKPGLLWIANDGGNGPDLYLAGTDGSYQGTLHINGAVNVDWEDMDSFVWNGRPWLLVADTGDNAARRNFCTIYLLPEPSLPVPGQISETVPGRKIVFRYEDGPRDCEAVAADPAGGKILLISKRANPPGVYELPLAPEKPGEIQTARKIGVIHVERPLESPLVPYGNQPTGLSISPDGSLAAVLTYYGVFLFPHRKGETWAKTFSKKPQRLAPHRQKQAEAIAFSRDGKTIFVLSEGTTPPVVAYKAK
ncbi:MAG: hypothetical protein WC003_09050 [Terrimicrobiaceae bacterium]